MELSLLHSSTPRIQHMKLTLFDDSKLPIWSFKRQISQVPRLLMIKCEAKESNDGKYEIGSPIVVTEAPKMIKTAASVPCLRVNSGLVNPGDVGRIVSRKPKDVWAIRLAIGTYLIDAKYFKLLEELDE